MDDLGRKVAVLGLGKSGYESALFLKEKGYSVFVSEIKDTPPVLELGRELEKRDIAYETGAHSLEKILASDWVLISPGISPATPVYQAVSERRLPILSEIEIASRYCPTPHVVAVTGSCGKTTVTTLLRLVFEASGRKAVSCGNIGNPWVAELARLGKDDIVVVELSSFQLQHCMRFRPSVGVLLNITPNHQDWHKDMAEYAAAKLRLFQNQVPADHAFIRRKDQAALFQEYPFHGRVHYLDENAANPNHDAVRQVTALFGVSAKQADEVFAGFRGIEHRMEDVGTLNGVSFINDSKATTAASLAWALEKCRDHSVLLIAGGIAKSRDFGDIKDLVARKAKKVLILGKAVPVLREAWEGAAPLQEARSLDEAVREASREAKAGDTVLLSPACSSFDMFQNYEHRGREFKRCVAELFSRSEPPKVRI